MYIKVQIVYIIVMEVLSGNFHEGLPLQILNADDLVLVADMEEVLVKRNNNCKDCMEKKGF